MVEENREEQVFTIELKESDIQMLQVLVQKAGFDEEIKAYNKFMRAIQDGINKSQQEAQEQGTVFETEPGQTNDEE